MKTLFLSALSLFLSCSYLKAEQCDSLLIRIQDKIDYLLYKQDIDSLNYVCNKLNDDTPNHIYWQAYTRYSMSIYFQNSKKMDKSEIEVKHAIQLLEKYNKKSAEHYSLLGLCYAQLINFTNGMQSGIISEKIIMNANKALRIDDKNMRAYYLLGSTDFFTPKEFGGGKKVEKYLLKAISLPENPTNLSCTPHWGKDYSYIFLIQFYLNNNRNEIAKRYISEAYKLYPNNQYIIEMYEAIYKEQKSSN